MATARPDQPPVREEARPLLRGELLEDQWQAVQRIVTQLRRLSGLAPRSTPAGPPHVAPTELAFLPRIDEQRHSQVFLIEGERGSGKTATLVTLLDALNGLARGTLAGDRSALDRPAHIVSQPRDGEEHADRWIDVDPTTTLIPLPIIDVRPLPRTRQLLPMLVGVFEPLVRALEPSEPQALASPARSTRDDLRSRFEHLMRSVTIGWSIDAPPTMPGELLAAETELRKLDQWRRELVPAFGRFMDRATAAITAAYPSARSPLFVVPLDDIDMNPERTEEALDLVRALSHPRVAYVLTGHLGLMKVVLTNAFFRALDPPEPARLASLEVAGPLAVAHVEKVVPLEHRSSLPGIPPLERARWLREQARLDTSDLTAELIGSALPAFPRQLAAMIAAVRERRSDATLALQRLGGPVPSADALVAGLAWDRAVETHEYGYLGWTNRLRGRISLRGETLVVDGAMFVPRGRVDQARSFRLGDLGFGAAIGVRWEIVARGAAITESLEPQDPTRASPFNASTDIILPSNMASIVLLAMAAIRDHGVAATFAARMSGAPHVAITHFNRPAGVLLHLRWPLPQWRDVTSALRFDRTFGHAVGELREAGPEEARTGVAKAFLRGLLATFGVNTGESIEENVRKVSESEVPELRDYAASALPLLATPEAGLSAADANEVLRALGPRNIEGLVAMRHAWVSKALNDINAGHLVEAVLALSARGGFDWFSMAEDFPRRAEPWERVRNTISKLDHKFADENVREARRTLFDALPRNDRERVAALLEELSRLRGGRSGLANLAHELWTRLSVGPVRSDVTMKRGTNTIVVAPRLRLTQGDAAKERHIIHQGQREAVILAPVEIESERAARAAGSEALTEFAYRFAWDVMVAQAGDTSSTTLSPFVPPTAVTEGGVARVVFPGVRAESTKQAPRYWFGPSTPLLGFWEDLLAAWNELVGELVENRSPAEQQLLLDRLSLRWIGAFPGNPSQLRFDQGDPEERATAIADHAVKHKAWTPSLLAEFARDAPGLSGDHRSRLLAAVPHEAAAPPPRPVRRGPTPRKPGA